MTQQDTILKWLSYGIFLVAVTVLNFSVLGRLPISMPLLLPMAAVAAGILEGAAFGAGHGLAAGLLLACVGHYTPLCIPLLSALGWSCGALARHVLRRDLVGHLICASVSMVTWEILRVLFHFTQGLAPIPVLAVTAFGELVWTLIFSLPVYWGARFCCRNYGRIYHE